MSLERSGKLESDPHCPECNSLLSGYGNVSEKTPSRGPKPDDPALCIYCGAILVYTDTMQLRYMTMHEFNAMPQQMQYEIAIALQQINTRIERQQRAN